MASSFFDKYPSKINQSETIPLAETATVTAEGPGTLSTQIPSSTHLLTSLYPGSLIRGVPASDTKATENPNFKAQTIPFDHFSSLNSLMSTSNPRPFHFLSSSIFALLCAKIVQSVSSSYP